MNMVVGKATEAAATAIVTAGTPSMWAFRFLRFRGVGEDFALGRLNAGDAAAEVDFERALGFDVAFALPYRLRTKSLQKMPEPSRMKLSSQLHLRGRYLQAPELPNGPVNPTCTSSWRALPSALAAPSGCSPVSWARTWCIAQSQGVDGVAPIRVHRARPEQRAR